MNRLQQALTRQGLATAMIAVVMSIAIGSAQAATWTGPLTAEEYSTATNWSDGLAPVSGSTQDINVAATVERSVDSIAGRTFVSGGGTLNVTGGAHNDDTTGAGTRNFLGRGSTGTVNQSGGDYLIGHMLSIGGGGANGNGSYFLTGGTLDLYRGANSIIDGSNPHGRPSLEVSDEEAAGSGLFEISGGSFVTRFGAGIGTTGVFSVVGSAGTINIGNNSNGDGTWLQQSGGTIQAAVDAGGLSTIFVNDNGLDGGVLVEFLAGSVLDLGFDGISPVAGTWTVLEAVNADITDGGLGLSGTTASGWSFNVDNSGTNGLLTATYTAIPEPASIALLGLAGMFMARRRSV